MRNRVGYWRLAGLIALPAALIAGPAQPASASASYSAPLRTAISSLRVTAEIRTGYVRTLFPHWIDADGDGCDTRNEVLIAEATVSPRVSSRVGSRCGLTGGRWYSYVNDTSYLATSSLDIDHVVALAEAWDSGARTWTTARRRAYANDLGDPRSLVAIKDSVNQSKGDRDPAGWMPPYAGATCRYVTDWVAVKIRWRLTADPAERATLVRIAATCANTTLRVAYA